MVTVAVTVTVAAGAQPAVVDGAGLAELVPLWLLFTMTVV